MKKLLLIFLIIFSSQSFAEWKAVIFSQGTTIFVDFDNIRKSDGNIFFWQLVNLKEAKRFGQEYYISYKVYRQADCKLFKVKDIQTFIYPEEFGEGNLIHKMDDKGSWLYPPPGTVSEEILKRVCE